MFAKLLDGRWIFRPAIPAPIMTALAAIVLPKMSRLVHLVIRIAHPVLPVAVHLHRRCQYQRLLHRVLRRHPHHRMEKIRWRRTCTILSSGSVGTLQRNGILCPTAHLQLTTSTSVLRESDASKEARSKCLAIFTSKTANSTSTLRPSSNLASACCLSGLCLRLRSRCPKMHTSMRLPMFSIVGTVPMVSLSCLQPNKNQMMRHNKKQKQRTTYNNIPMPLLSPLLHPRTITISHLDESYRTIIDFAVIDHVAN